MEPDRVPAAGANSKPWKKILLVERDPALAALLRAVAWQEISCEIVCVTTREQALRLIPHLQPDLLVFGFRLADRTGIAAFAQRAASKERVSPPTLFLNTGQFGARTGPSLSLCTDCSFDLDALLQTIEALLGGRDRDHIDPLGCAR